MSWRWGQYDVYRVYRDAVAIAYFNFSATANRAPAGARTGLGLGGAPARGGPRRRGPPTATPVPRTLLSISVLSTIASLPVFARVYLSSRAAQPVLIHAHRLIDRLTGSTSLTTCAARAAQRIGRGVAVARILDLESDG